MLLVYINCLQCTWSLQILHSTPQAPVSCTLSPSLEPYATVVLLKPSPLNNLLSYGHRRTLPFSWLTHVCNLHNSHNICVDPVTCSFKRHASCWWRYRSCSCVCRFSECYPNTSTQSLLPYLNQTYCLKYSHYSMHAFGWTTKFYEHVVLCYRNYCIWLKIYYPSLDMSYQWLKVEEQMNNNLLQVA